MRIVSVFLLLTILQPIAAPYYALALTHGPHQPEYTAYEELNATDMVNLLTGDFTYSLPVLEVPGPSGSFSVPLTYNAGIGPEQQSSWAGLGWNVNVGAITRGINQFPDDAAGESRTIRVMDMGVRGWRSSVLGLGSMGWNSVEGHYGDLSLLGILNGEWSENSSSVGIAGFNVEDKGMRFNGAQFGIAVASIVSYGMVGASAQAGTAAAAIAKQAAFDLAVNAAMSAFKASSSPSAPTAGYWRYSKRDKQKLFYREFKVWLDQTRIEDMYGALYSGRAPLTTYVADQEHVSLTYKNAGANETLKAYQKTTSAGLNAGSASDVNYQVDESKAFQDVHSPTFLALDDYAVRGPGISGVIEPYRLDVGSVSHPREMSRFHTRLAPVPYLDYKVPFQYKGSSNEYFHHVGGASSVTSPTPRLGITIEPSSTDPKSVTSLTYNFNDITYKNERVRSDLAPMLEASNTKNKFPQGRHVEWLTNADITASTTYDNWGFLDFLPASERQKFRADFTMAGTGIPTNYSTSVTNFTGTIPTDASVVTAVGSGDLIVDYSYTINDANGNPVEYVNSISTTVTRVGTTNSLKMAAFNSNSPGYGRTVSISLTYKKAPQVQQGIGAYVVTSQDGTSYHYALPVYDYNERSEVIDKNDVNKKSLITRTAPFANTWLLTAITGSDFVDRNLNGLADDGDWGYWVKFNYGNHLDNYQWRAPFENYRRDYTDRTNNYSRGTKQVYYLNTIETASHVALFVKSPRLDGRGTAGETLLKLDEISLISKEQYKKLTTPTAQGGLGLANYSSQVKAVCTSAAITSTQRTFLTKNSLKRVVLTHDYILCGQTPNSTASNKAKLTLTRLSLRGRNDLKIVPDYVFEYGENPSYNPDGWDGWDMYSASGTNSGGTHKAVSDGTQWSLKKIMTPLGSELMIAYERDTYGTVSGVEAIKDRVIYNHGGKQWDNHDTKEFWTGGPNSGLGAAIAQGRVKAGTVFDLVEGTAALRCVDGSSQVVNYEKRRLTVVYIDEPNELIVFDQFPFEQPYCAETDKLHYDYNMGAMNILDLDKLGGNVRVASITMTDGSSVPTKVRYLYNNDLGYSSGAVAQEPESVRNPLTIMPDDLGFNPRTPVVYGQVTVLTGGLSTDTDYHTRTVYKFETPQSGTIAYRFNNVYSQSNLDYKYVAYKSKETSDGKTEYTDFAFLKEHIIEDHSSKIGALKSIEVFQKDGKKVSSVALQNDYRMTSSSGSTPGIFTQATLMADVIRVPVTKSQDETEDKLFHKLGKTTVVSYQYDVVKKVETQNETFTTTTQYNTWDRYTGEVLDKTVTTSLGVSGRSVTVPAYTKYTGMGPKALGGKNLLASVAAEFQYKTNATGTILGLVDAHVQTWRNDWGNYRTYTNGTYTEIADGPAVWRKSAEYDWTGTYARLNPDGTRQFVESSDQFNFTPDATNAGWQKATEVVQYDHFSMPLDDRDMNGIASAVKMGYNEQLMLAQASNAAYNEIAFSSAEDKLADRPFFGGEVGLGTGVQRRKSKGETTQTHTGDAVVSVAGGGSAFVYKTTALRAQTYQAKVWANSLNGKLYYRVNGGAEVTSTIGRQVGNWYLLSIDIPITAVTTSFEVGVKSTASTVLFDDFRFQPMRSNMVCHVYAPDDVDFTNATAFGSVHYQLDNDNLYTKYEYDGRGELVKVFKESFQYGEKIVSETKSYYKRINN